MTGAPQTRPPRYWPGFWLNLLLPGAGFSVLGRPWLHLLGLGVAVLAWTLLILVFLSGVLLSDSGSSYWLTACISGDLLGVAALYAGLSLGYRQTYARLSRTTPVQPRWWPVWLHLALLTPLLVLTLRSSGRP